MASFDEDRYLAELNARIAAEDAIRCAAEFSRSHQGMRFGSAADAAVATGPVSLFQLIAAASISVAVTMSASQASTICRRHQLLSDLACLGISRRRPGRSATQGGASTGFQRPQDVALAALL